jgi:hypothetical protein
MPRLRGVQTVAAVEGGSLLCLRWGSRAPGVCDRASFHCWPRRGDRLIFRPARYNHGERPLDGGAYAPT